MTRATESDTQLLDSPVLRDEIDDAILVTSLRNRDRAAFDRFIEQTAPRLQRLLTRMVCRGSDIDDLLQEVYLRAWRSIERFRGECKLETWLIRIAVNLANTWRKKPKWQSLGPVEEGNLHAALPTRDAEIQRAFDAALDRLPTEMRAVFVLHEVERLSYQEIADTMQIPMGTVMSRLHRARGQLMSNLQEWLEDSVS